MRQNRMLIFSVLIGIVAVIGATLWLGAERDLVQVVVATKDIDVGDELTRDNVGLTRKPKQEVYADSATNVESLLGRKARTVIPTGSLVKQENLVPVVAQIGVVTEITPGMRGYSIGITAISGVAGFALPGNFVDVLVRSKANTEQPISKLLLERVRVLAVDQESSVTGDAKPKVVNVITLEVTPKQAETLDTAQAAGNLSLALRSQTDKGTTLNNGVSQCEVAGSCTTIEVIRGTVRSNY